jgi:ABC-type Zn uptake system ZnuABC Zn-binding protein ZnuA
MSYTTIEQAERQAKERKAKLNPPMSEITLRDHFAGLALAGDLEQGLEDDMNSGWWHDPQKIAKRAYAIADAMIKARNGQN